MRVGMANGRGSSTSAQAFAPSDLSSRTAVATHKGGVNGPASVQETSGRRTATRLTTLVFSLVAIRKASVTPTRTTGSGTPAVRVAPC